MIHFLAPSRQWFVALPTALAGLALGIASLGWCWENALDLKGNGQLIGAIIATFLLIMLLIKFVLHPILIKADLQHHVTGSVIPTFTMAIMIVANNLAPTYLVSALNIWCAAIAIHLVFLAVFIYYRIKSLHFEQMLPSWFIPPVGIVVAVVTFPGGALKPMAEWLMNFGLISYAILLPIMLIRLVFGEVIKDAEKPTMAVLAAPASLCLSGYLTITNSPSLLIVSLLTVLALAMTAFIYMMLFTFLRLPFSPAFSSFTFPLVIGAMALFKTHAYLLTQRVDDIITNALLTLAMLELVVATAMVVYVSIRYCWHFYPYKKVAK